MISFPLFLRLEVSDYQLYPGLDGSNSLKIPLGFGPWMVLGVNGLGKSTLLLLMRYLIAGAVRVRPAGFAGEREDLQVLNQRFFAVRVADDARDASGILEVAFGENILKVERRLSNLSLKSAEVISADKSRRPIGDEKEYRQVLSELMQLSQFEDVLRVIDHVVFLLESRQSLIWDQAAQFEIFRALLTPQASADLRKLEGEIISSDSSARNLSAILHKMTKEQDKEVRRQRNAGDTAARIASLQAAIHEATAAEESLQVELDQLDEERDNARLQLKRADSEVDSTTQEYERLKFDTFRAAFGTMPPTDQYLYLKLMSEKTCFVCGKPADQAASEIEERVLRGRCVVCGNDHSENYSQVDFPENWKDRASSAYARVEVAKATLSENQKTYADRAVRAAEARAALVSLQRRRDEHRIELQKVSKGLPANDADKLTRDQTRISTIAEQIKIFQSRRSEAEENIQGLLNDLREKTSQISERLYARFDEIARPFFAEHVRLVYAPRNTRIGQTGRQLPFPAFEVEMTSGATQGDYVRRKADQVSLSQREYLDLIFRMVLMDVLGQEGASIVVDGPEGSLDAVFAERAGDLFSAYTSRSKTNVIMACNIVEGGFIPHVLRDLSTEEKRSHVVNLLDQAVPTAALRELADQYRQKVESILGEAP